MTIVLPKPLKDLIYMIKSLRFGQYNEIVRKIKESINVLEN